MADRAPSGRVEVVRDRLTPARADQVLAFWASERELSPLDAMARLRDVVSVLLDDRDELLGVSSVEAALVPLLGGRRYYVHDCPVAAEPGDELILADATFAALEAEFDPQRRDPIGLCLLLAASPWLRSMPGAEWRGPGRRLTYAGYDTRGRQVRVTHFAGARVGERAPHA